MIMNYELYGKCMWHEGCEDAQGKLGKSKLRSCRNDQSPG